MSDSSSIEETIFLGARQISRPEERDAYLDQKCGGDPALRERVERMLHAEQKADQFLANDPLQIDKTAVVPIPEGEAVGTMIGPYKLLQQIGEGGCGIVYMAEQEQPIRRRVALKVIKPGMDTRQVIARFEAERQALAMMDHPNIARLFDAGMTGASVAAGVPPAVEPGVPPVGKSADNPNARDNFQPGPGGKMPPSTAGGTPAATLAPGRPYFVMELVRGIRITEYCDQNNLSARDRLDLFTKVVQAVQHAHQKGIIHRDIKPSNVLVTLHDGVPVPKVIDFGIAKALEQKLTDKTLFTQFEQFIGTPAYTSPEQAEMSGLDIDTRSDIYSLGVLLYELLVGKTPFDAHALVHSGIDEMRRIIREQEPARPSTRLGTMVAGEVTTTAQRRRVSAPELVHLLKGDLDWIVMKCLEKDRTRRYATANGLADDIQHYLGNEPVTARPPSQVYRWGKLIRRNKLAFAAGAAVLMALLGGVGVSAWQAVRAHRAEQAAKEEKESAEAVLQFFREKVLAAARPEEALGLGKDVTLRQAIDAAEAEIGKSFTNRSLVEASIRETMGSSYRHLGEPALAIPQLERAVALRRRELGTEHKSTIDAMMQLVQAYALIGASNQARHLGEEVVELTQAANRTDLDLASLFSVYKRAGKSDRSLPVLEGLLKLCKTKFGPEAKETIYAMFYLGDAYRQTGKGERAVPLLEEVVRVDRANRRNLLSSLQELAHTYHDLGKIEQAIVLYEELLKLTKAKFGEGHRLTLWRMCDLGNGYSVAKRHEQALSLLEETLALQKASLGPDSTDTLTLATMNRLAAAYDAAGRIEDAVRLDEETLRRRRAKFGVSHSDTRESINYLANGYTRMGRFDDAESLYRESLGLKQDSLTATLGLARVLLENAGKDTNNPARARQRTAEGEQLARDYLAKARIRHANDPGEMEKSLYEIAELRRRLRQFAETEPLYRELLQSRRARLEAGHKDVIDATASLGRLLADWAWAERANPVASDARRLTSSGPKLSPTNAPKANQSLVTSAATVPHERAREAERLLRTCLAAHLNGTNTTHWRVGDVKSRLGGALVSVAVTDPALDATTREAKLAEAETLLLEGHQRLQESKSTDKKYKRDALERLTRLYQAWGKPDPLSEWQQQLEAFDKTKPNPATAEETQ